MNKQFTIHLLHYLLIFVNVNENTVVHCNDIFESLYMNAKRLSCSFKLVCVYSVCVAVVFD